MDQKSQEFLSFSHVSSCVPHSHVHNIVAVRLTFVWKDKYKI